MTITCIVCKKEPIPYDDSRSFHKFPKNNDLKTKWMIAIGKFSIKKTARICSDHFDSGSYHNTDGYTTLRRLLSTAVPRLISNKDVTNDCTETSGQTVIEYCQSTESHINIKIEENISDSECNVNVDNAYLISQSTVNNGTNKSNDTEGAYPYLIISPLETADAPNNDLKISHDEVIKQDHQDSPGYNIKRENPFKNKVNHTKIKKISHRINFKNYCFTRAKFSSDEAWAEFQEFSAFIKNRTASAAKNISRKQKKLTYLKMVIEKLKKSKEFKDAEAAQGLDK